MYMNWVIRSEWVGLSLAKLFVPDNGNHITSPWPWPCVLCYAASYAPSKMEMISSAKSQMHRQENN